MSKSRRKFLQGAGGVCLSLPWLEKLHGVAHAQSAGNGPRRVIVMTYQMGVPLGQWRPSGTGSNFTLPYVTAPLEPFRDRCLFVSAIDNTVLDLGGDSFIYGHPAKTEAALTGTLTTGAFASSNSNSISELRSAPDTSGGANGPSVEHVIGQSLRDRHAFSSVDLGVDGDAVYGGVSSTGQSRFHFEGPGNPVSLRMRPNEALSALFAGVSADGPSQADEAARQLRLRNKSVLDAVRDSFRELQQGLGSQDRRRLQDHADRIRQLEIDTRVGAACTLPTGIDGGGSYSGYRMDQLAPLQNRLLAQAMGCELAPVGRIEFTNQQNPRFGISELDSTLDASSGQYDWHAMVHGDPLPGTGSYLRPGRDGGGGGYDPRLLDGYRFFVEQFADLLSELDALPEGPETSVLDNSLVVLATDLGEGLGHAHMKMGYVLAGNLGGARTGYHLDAGPRGESFQVGGNYFYAPSRYNVNQLLNSMLDMAGASGSVGLSGYLEQRGRPRRIDELFG